MTHLHNCLMLPSNKIYSCFMRASGGSLKNPVNQNNGLWIAWAPRHVKHTVSLSDRPLFLQGISIKKEHQHFGSGWNRRVQCTLYRDDLNPWINKCCETRTANSFTCFDHVIKLNNHWLFPAWFVALTFLAYKHLLIFTIRQNGWRRWRCILSNTSRLGLQCRLRDENLRQNRK